MKAALPPWERSGTFVRLFAQWTRGSYVGEDTLQHSVCFIKAENIKSNLHGLYLFNQLQILYKYGGLSKVFLECHLYLVRYDYKLINKLGCPESKFWFQVTKGGGQLGKSVRKVFIGFHS